MSIIISSDEIKKGLPGYSPDKASAFHEDSAKKADKLFDYHLKSSDYKKVVLMSGGPASGKTEFVSEYLENEDYLIFDGVLPSESGAKIKIEHIAKAKRYFEVYAVWPSDFKIAYNAFLSRDRKFSDKYFFSKHSSSRKTLLWIVKNYPDIIVEIFINTYTGDDLSFEQIIFDKRSDLLDFLTEKQYSEKEIIDEVFN